MDCMDSIYTISGLSVLATKKKVGGRLRHVCAGLAAFAQSAVCFWGPAEVPTETQTLPCNI